MKEKQKVLLFAGLVIAVSLLLFCGCSKYEQAKKEHAEQQGLDRGLFQLWPGGSLEGGSLKYISFQDGLAVFEYQTGKGSDWTCFDTHFDLENRRATYQEESRLCHQSFSSYFYLTVKFGNAYYAAHVESIDKVSGVISMRIDYD